jgi:hypothetical protein
VRSAAAASDGSSFYAAWVTAGSVLRVAQILPGGFVTAPVTVAADATNAAPALAWNGRELVVAWSTAQTDEGRHRDGERRVDTDRHAADR